MNTLTPYEKRVAQLESIGATTSDAQGCAEVEFVQRHALQMRDALRSIYMRCSFEHVTDWRQTRREIGELAGQALMLAEGKQ